MTPPDRVEELVRRLHRRTCACTGARCSYANIIRAAGRAFLELATDTIDPVKRDEAVRALTEQMVLEDDRQPGRWVADSGLSWAWTPDAGKEIARRAYDAGERAGAAAKLAEVVKWLRTYEDRRIRAGLNPACGSEPGELADALERGALGGSNEI